ncbi:MAG: NAD(P)-dependent alcohol dehydrogenase [Planctomycetales bacterium]|nr:NAD(P)-dependent alcohol dehydrogenase [bacterium]UNM08156.1 MAG: NAD(P)-dependent alcohol dehydrogenase [Planctomycetales bacterium]
MPSSPEQSPSTMSAVVFSEYGGPEVLSIAQRPVPAPGRTEVLVRISSAAVSTADVIMRKGSPFVARLAMGLLKPGKPVLGTEYSGVVEQCGADVDRFVKGDIVVGATGDDFGAHAQYICVDEQAVLAQVPEGLDAADMLAISEGAMTALPFLRDAGGIRKGMQVLVNGASGSVGSAAVQLARHFGAQVTAVCSAGNAELVRSLGATEVIDYASEDFTAGEARYDIVFDAVGRSSFAACRRVLKPDGAYLCTVLSFGILMQNWLTGRSSGQRARIILTGLRDAKLRAKDLRYICRLAGEGVLKPVIDSRYPLEQVREAHTRVDSGHKRGSVLLDLP